MPERNATQPTGEQSQDVEQQEQFAILKAFLKTFHHFFGDFTTIFSSVDDPRCPEYHLNNLGESRS